MIPRTLLFSLTLAGCVDAMPEPESEWETPACPSVSVPKAVGTVENSDINEASGLVASLIQDVYWVHNDSGDSPRVFAISPDGQPVGTLDLEDVTAFDWEDMARDENYLFLADIGDNAYVRSTVTIYTIVEPANFSGNSATIPIETSVLVYPDGAENAEVFLVDPLTGDWLIVAKSDDGDSRIYGTSEPGPGPTTLQEMGSLHFGEDPLIGSALATGGDVSPDGLWVGIVTYSSAFLWPRNPALPLHNAFDNEPCEMPRAREAQGESFAFTADGLEMVTISEGSNPPVHLATGAF